ncbi:hypothetical protein [Azospirillum sp. TSO22-1]|uniref:hypothetical protein n=1 Tax=Azospirillum sp. TSO22-1 TaxID=716789 RepID=UPI000D64FCCF|nr:hypothetical protein [Azospirillum sp. TSO22-1]
MFRSATLAAVVALALSGPAWAQSASAISADGAAAIRAAIAKGLKQTFPDSEDEGVEVFFDGEPTVTPAGDHYEVALPPLTISGEDASLDVGVIRLNVVPKADATYAVEVTLPSRMELTDEEDKPSVLTIGKQRFTGVWNTAVENFVSADIAYGDIALVPPKNQGALRIGSLTATQDMRQDGGPNIWSGPVAGAISDVTLSDKKATLLKIGSVTMEANYGRMDLGKVGQLKALATKHAAAGTEPPAAQFLPLLGGILGDATMRLRVSNVAAGDAEGRVAFDFAGLQFGITDMDRAASTLSFGFQGDGLKIEPLPGPQQFMPQRFDVQVSLAKLPNAAIGQAVTAMAALEEQQRAKPSVKKKGAGESKNEARDALMAVTGTMLTEAATNAGTELRLDKLTLDTPAASGSVTGALRMLSKAAMGAVGGAEVILRGLDSAAEALKPKPGAQPDPGTQETLGMIAMLQAMGQQGKDEAGKDIRTYKFELTEGGQVLLNGADMSAMMGMGAAAPEPAPEAKPKGGKKN